MVLTEVTDNISLTIFLAIIIPILVIISGYFLYRSIVKENKRFHEEVTNYIDGIQTKKEINASISSYISKQFSATFSLMLIDIDKFNDIIETFGENDANKIIHDLALKILHTLPKRVEMARIDTDQFLVFFKAEYSKEDVNALARKILLLITEPISLFGEESINITGSISLSIFPNHGNNIKKLMESLDIAMYICKKNGGNQCLMYTEEKGLNETENIKYYKQIKNAILNKEFTLYYQPIINCSTNQLFGFEGLLRWNHPDLGVLSPYKFISIMEQSGDIIWVGEWGLEALIKEYIEISRKFSNVIVCTMNLSPKQLADPLLPSSFQKIVRKYRVPANSIVLEIEEFALYDKHNGIKENILKLKDLGFKIAVDGFGLDFNGIKRLEELQIDIVKLDKEYLNSDTDAELKKHFINILLDFARERNIIIIAECIEDQENLNVVINEGINYVQGYYFSKPLDKNGFEEYLKNGNFIA